MKNNILLSRSLRGVAFLLSVALCCCLVVWAQSLAQIINGYSNSPEGMMTANPLAALLHYVPLFLGVSLAFLAFLLRCRLPVSGFVILLIAGLLTLLSGPALYFLMVLNERVYPLSAATYLMVMLIPLSLAVAGFARQFSVPRIIWLMLALAIVAAFVTFDSRFFIRVRDIDGNPGAGLRFQLTHHSIWAGHDELSFVTDEKGEVYVGCVAWSRFGNTWRGGFYGEVLPVLVEPLGEPFQWPLEVTVEPLKRHSQDFSRYE